MSKKQEKVERKYNERPYYNMNETDNYEECLLSKLLQNERDKRPAQSDSKLWINKNYGYLETKKVVN